MKKYFLIILLLFFSISAFSQKIQFADTLNGKVILREVSYKYPLPIAIKGLSLNILGLDTTKISFLAKNNTFTGLNIFNLLQADSITANFLKANLIHIDTSLALYSQSGLKWFYANSVDSSLTVNGSNMKLNVNYSNGFGNSALENNSGSFSNGFGNYALHNNSGNYSNGFGYNALNGNKGHNSNGLGFSALNGNTGNYSNGIGDETLENNSGILCNGFGFGSLIDNKGDNSLGLGNYTKKYNPYEANKLYIDNLDRLDSVRSLNQSLIQGDFSTDSSQQKLRFNAVVSVQGNILPTTTGNYNLGSEIKQFDTLFAKVVVSNIPNKIWGDSSYFETYFNANRTSPGGMPLYYPYANLNGISCSASPIYLQSCNFSYANLRNANLEGADLRNANLEGADLTGVYLVGADLTNANLTSADLTSANLTDANLTSANLTDANLTGAKLIGAAVNFEKSYIWNNCTYSATTTIWIDGNPIGSPE